MTLPNERYNAIREAERFLLDMLDPKKIPRLPKAVRERARHVLRHFPWESHVRELAKACPEVIKEEGSGTWR